MSVEEIQRMIERAFRRFQQPEQETELTRAGIDGDCVVRNYFGLSREQVEDRSYQGGYYLEDFSYMEPAAVGYYLPALMVWMMKRPDNWETWIYLSGYLLPREGSDEIWWNLKGLGPEAYEAIEVWSQWMAEQLLLLDQNVDAIEAAERIVKVYGGLK